MFVPAEVFIKDDTQVLKVSNTLYSRPIHTDWKLILSSLCDVPKSIASVLVTLINKLFNRSEHSMGWSSFTKVASIVHTSEAEKNRTVSSAYMRTLHSTTALRRSLRWRVNNSGPQMDLCCTLTDRGSAVLFTPWNSTTSAKLRSG